ncbi:hypothetical protein PILCRDRAFT_811646 [Piloderma croceum F 1598]|uniref:Uncharacterized protein n=1 Tax=Piloderma croceum (strain F 1598) TaxID=765440 RepID=A0A0C3BXB5_PILCF|nr:hypothetical protein PILCRDRAFT_811646 [Piloderma croceum F 1598]
MNSVAHSPRRNLGALGDLENAPQTQEQGIEWYTSPAICRCRWKTADEQTAVTSAATLSECHSLFRVINH